MSKIEQKQALIQKLKAEIKAARVANKQAVKEARALIRKFKIQPEELVESTENEAVEA